MVSQSTSQHNHGGRPRQPSGGQPSAAAGLNMASLDPMRILRMYYPWMIASVIAGAVIGVVAFFGLKMFLPKHTAMVLFETLPPPSSEIDGAGSTGTTSGGAKELEIYMRTQVELLKSDQILGKVLREPEFLQTGWAKDYMKNGVIENAKETIEELKEDVNARVVPDTSIIRLAVSVRGRQDCAVIANTISDVFLADNREISTRDVNKKRNDIDNQVRSLRQQVVSLDQQVEALLGNAGITALEERNSTWAVEMTNIQMLLAQVSEQLTSVKEQMNGYESMLNSPGGVVYPDTVRQAAEEDFIVSNLQSQLAMSRSELAAVRERFGDNHREVKVRESSMRNLQHQYEKLVETQMEIKFNSLLDSMRTTVRSLDATETELRDRLARVSDKMNETTAILKQAENLTSDRDSKLALLSEMESMASLYTLIANQGSRLRVIQSGEPPELPSFPRIFPTMALSMLGTCAIVGGLILLKELREQRVRSPQDLAMIPRTPVLGCIPDLAMDLSAPERFESAVIDRPHGAIAESVRQVRTGLVRALQASGHRTVVFAGGMPESGTTAVVANIAMNLANIGQRVLVIDANLRRPRMHEVLGVPQAPGLGEVLNGLTPLADAIRPTAHENLSILPAGERRTGAFERFGSARMDTLLKETKGNFDIVLVDSAPAVVAGDAEALTTVCDAVVLVVRAFSETRGLVGRLRQQLGDHKAAFLGVIVNAVRPSAGGYFMRNVRTSHEYHNGLASSGPIKTEAEEKAA